MATTISFRARTDFVEQTQSSVSMSGLKTSDYVHGAVRDKNERVMADHLAMLSHKLSAKHLSFNEAIADTIKDGLV